MIVQFECEFEPNYSWILPQLSNLSNSLLEASNFKEAIHSNQFLGNLKTKASLGNRLGHFTLCNSNSQYSTVFFML